MTLNLIKVSLSALLMLFFLSCSNNGHERKNSISNASKTQQDTCQLDLGSAQMIELHVGCINCHTYDEKRQYPHVPTIREVANIDSLKLINFIFKTRHNGYFLKDTMLINHSNKALDSLNECDKRNLVYFIKSNNRVILDVLKVPGNRQEN